ncbi:MAG: hypothetical protein C0621_02565 [Desulfuromonas sp.]|nr:MAG: hypothetical protein C0621_02565 [Desulfuromonas sp.]
MLFAILSFPLSLLCLYLGVLTWRRRYMKQALTLLTFALFFFAVALSGVVFTWFGYSLWQTI